MSYFALISRWRREKLFKISSADVTASALWGRKLSRSLLNSGAFGWLWGMWAIQLSLVMAGKRKTFYPTWSMPRNQAHCLIKKGFTHNLSLRSNLGKQTDQRVVEIQTVVLSFCSGFFSWNKFEKQESPNYYLSHVCFNLKILNSILLTERILINR